MEGGGREEGGELDVILISTEQLVSYLCKPGFPIFFRVGDLRMIAGDCLGPPSRPK